MDDINRVYQNMESPVYKITADIIDGEVKFTQGIIGQALTQWGFSKSDIENKLLELEQYRNTGLTPSEITALQSENAQLKEQLHDSFQGHLLEVVIPKLEAENAHLRSELETVTKQRDMAVDNVRQSCETCAHKRARRH